MNKPRIYQPERRLVEKVKQPGGITIGEATQRADKNLAVARAKYFGGVDEKLKIAVDLAAAEDGARLAELRATAAEVADCASTYELVEMFAAAHSLRRLLTEVMAKAGAPPWPSIRVHVDAMISLRRPEIDGEASARRAVLDGLRKVAAVEAKRG
jgi:hypothetical protein